MMEEFIIATNPFHVHTYACGGVRETDEGSGA